MADTSAILGLPYLLPSQAQKHVTHNEALTLLDMLAQISVEGIEAVTPPASPEEGEVWALGDVPVGAWEGYPNRLAGFQDGGWVFVLPRQGWVLWDRAAQVLRVRKSGTWVVPAASAPDEFGINATADAVNRLAVSATATLLSHEGAGHQLKINKAGAGETASLLFQSGFTGHAEMGLAGGTDFSVKVSAGGAWHSALVADAGSGAVDFPTGLSLGGGALLDAYAEGGWTPQVADAESGGTVASVGSATGRYSRIGDTVTVSFLVTGIATAGLTGAADLCIRNLPYPARVDGASRFTAPVQLENVTFSGTPYLWLLGGGSALRLRRNVSGGGGAMVTVADLASGSAAIGGSLTYRL